jgi:hypothetical protein
MVSLTMDRDGADGDGAIAPCCGLGEALRFSCHSRRFSFAHDPHELKYAPAFWLAWAAVAWA